MTPHREAACACGRLKIRLAGEPRIDGGGPRLADLSPGEAYQFDWSHEVILLNGVTVIVKVAHIRLCHGRSRRREMDNDHIRLCEGLEGRPVVGLAG